jgi:hypothetical protein
MSAAYLGPIIYKAYFETGTHTNANDREVPWKVAPLAASAAASLLLGLFPAPILNVAERAAESVFQSGSHP